jgi:transketolase
LREELPPWLDRRLALEAASAFGWDRWVGPRGDVLALGRFGESGRYEDLQKLFGFTPENVAFRAKKLL